MRMRAVSGLAVLALSLSSCGSPDDEVATDPGSPTTGSSLSAPEQAYLADARPFASALGDPDTAQGRTSLLAVGHDWCAWRQSAAYGSVSDEQFFGELLIEPEDGEGIRKAADEHLCPA